MRFNINHYVAVQLTDEGRKLLKEQNNKLRERFPLYSEFKIEENWDGWSKWQLWDLMNRLGKHIYNGCKVPFKPEIKLLGTIDD